MMVAPENDPTNTADREITASRVFDAPRALVFRMFTDPDHLAHWWGPKGFTTTTFKMDVKPGGVWRFVMHGPDGVDYQNQITYVEVVEPERLVYKHGGGGKNLEPVNFEVTITFTEEHGKTRMDWRMVFPSAAARNHVADKYGAVEGLHQTIGRLADVLPTVATADEEFVVTRAFDAPRDLVYKAWTEPDRLSHWWGPKGCTPISSTLDLRPGGVFHYGMRLRQGQEMWGKWTFRDIIPPQRLVFVSSFSDAQGGVAPNPFMPKWPPEVLSTLLFAEYEGRTIATMRGVPVHATEAERNVFKANRPGMQQGWAGTLDQLAEYLRRA